MHGAKLETCKNHDVAGLVFKVQPGWVSAASSFGGFSEIFNAPSSWGSCGVLVFGDAERRGQTSRVSTDCIRYCKIIWLNCTVISANHVYLNQSWHMHGHPVLTFQDPKIHQHWLHRCVLRGSQENHACFKMFEACEGVMENQWPKKILILKSINVMSLKINVVLGPGPNLYLLLSTFAKNIPAFHWTFENSNQISNGPALLVSCRRVDVGVVQLEHSSHFFSQIVYPRKESIFSGHETHWR